MPFYYTEASLVLAECNKQGYEPTFFGCDGMDGILELDGFDVSLAEGLMLMTPFNAWGEDERTVNFYINYGGIINHAVANIESYDSSTGLIKEMVIRPA